MTSYELLAWLTATTALLYITWNYAGRRRERPSFRSVAIVVLGDIGRSPRMMYHAESFADNGFETYLIGYKGSNLIPSLRRSPRVRELYLSQMPKSLRSLPFLLLAPLKVALQAMTILLALLLRTPHPPEYIMVQNPPSIPTLALVWLVCRIRGSKLIIDWHNLGYTILALRYNGRENFIVKLAKSFEGYFGRYAYLHLFVTEAMRDKLTADWKLVGAKVVLHDRPPSHFHRSSEFESHEFFVRLMRSLSSSSLVDFLPPISHSQTAFTQLTTPKPPRDVLAMEAILPDGHSSSPGSQVPSLRPDRPALLVSSTSWTSDERFDILLNALQLYEQRARVVNGGSNEGTAGNKGKLPKVLMIVTGKGEERDRYMSEVMHLEKVEKWAWVRLRNLWLEAEDYPTLLGSADLGVSMHASSSNLDLPMKVVDMFGCGLPVCALDFECLHELVKEGENGYIFRNVDDLAKQLETLLVDFPASDTRLQQLHHAFNKSMKNLPSYSHTKRGDAEEWEWGTWAENWDRTMKPLLMRDVERDDMAWTS